MFNAREHKLCYGAVLPMEASALPFLFGLLAGALAV